MSFVRLVFSASFRARSEPIDVCSKFDFDKLEVIITSIVASFAWCPPVIVYKLPSLESSLSLRKCIGSIRRRLEGTSIPPGSGLDRTNRFKECLLRLGTVGTALVTRFFHRPCIHRA